MERLSRRSALGTAAGAATLAAELSDEGPVLVAVGVEAPARPSPSGWPGAPFIRQLT